MMKKLLIFISLLLMLFIANISLKGMNEILSSTTYDNTTVAVTTTTNSLYTFSDYNELISELYDSVYDDIYQDLYNEIIGSIDSEFYDEIYSRVEQKTVALLENSEIGLYIDDFQQKILDVVSQADSSVYAVISYLGSDGVGLGSGVVYRYDNTDHNYYIITNHHVIEGGNNFVIAFSDGNRYVANLIGFDEEVDIAILKFSAPDKPNINVSVLGNSAELQKGMFMLAAGNPRGLSFYGSVTLGIVSGLNRMVDSNHYVNYIQHDSAINPGNSGGPIYNLNKEVVGINVSKYATTEIEGMGFAIPIDIVKRIIERIEDGNLPDHTIMPRLGAEYKQVTSLYNNGNIIVSDLIINGNKITEALTIPLPNDVSTGLVIMNTISNSTLSTTEIKSGDIIYRIDSHQVLNEEDYFNYVYNNYEAGDTVVVYYYALNHSTLEYDSILRSVTVTFR
jgi:serine protease Do